MTGTIYKLTFPNGKVYIGQTTDYEGRMREHARLARKGKRSKLYHGWRKNGDPTMEPICRCPVSSLLPLEEYFVNRFDSYANGYNSTPGGETSPMLVKDISKVVTEKRTAWARTKEGKAKLSQGQRNRTPAAKRRSIEVLRDPATVANARAAAATPEAKARQIAAVNTPEIKALKSAASAEGWASGRYDSKCKHPCTCNGVPYKTVGQAIRALGLPEGASRNIRGKMIEFGRTVYERNGQAYEFVKA